MKSGGFRREFGQVWWEKEWQPVEMTVTLLRGGQTSLPPAVAALRCKVGDVARDTCVGGPCCLAKEKEYINTMVLGPADEVRFNSISIQCQFNFHSIES